MKSEVTSASETMIDQQRVLIVDDEPFNIKVLVDLLQPHYQLQVARDGSQALALLAEDTLPDLILLDWMMPVMDGIEVCRRLKADQRTRDIPIIFVTALGQAEAEVRALEAGAVDFITKPIVPPVVMRRVKTHLTLCWAQQELKQQNLSLEERVARRSREIVETRDLTIRALASLAETRDNETGNHIRRTQHYVRVLAEHLRAVPPYADELDDVSIELLFKSAPLHDIGKVGIPDAILLKPGKLTDAEFEIMKSHALLGRNALLATETDSAAENSFLRYAREIAYGHHEKWDGSGYPRGLAGSQIPLSARLMAVADVYDALISKRVYKPAMPHEKAVEYIVGQSGKHFDPAVVAAFQARDADFRVIAGQFRDD
jgi:putative two-component system response regulator